MPIQPERFKRGSLASGAKYCLGLEPDDSLSFPMLPVRGAQSGPTLVTTANIHGDEYEGVRAIKEIFEVLDPREVCGDWLAVPVANPPAFCYYVGPAPGVRENRWSLRLRAAPADWFYR